jgi:cobalt-zinc-cadmium efflux system membrane fusion protein
MNCIGILHFEETKRLPSISSKAIVFDKNKNFVLIYHGPENIETRSVEVHSIVDSLAFISSGLREGEKVIVADQLYIYDALND